MDSELKSLKIDRSQRASSGAAPWATKWILGGILILLLLGAGRFVYGKLNASTEVEVMRVPVPSSASSASGGGDVILNATGYIVAAHKIQVASKIVGRVAWIGVDKGDKVREGQVIVRLEDDEYMAQLQQAKGQLMALQARLAELEAGSRPEEIERSKAETEEGRAELTNAKINLERTQRLVNEGVLSKQALDDARARFDKEESRLRALDRTYELTRIGPRKEQIDAVRGQLVEARGRVSFFETQLANTLIKAPVTGTILERAVEKGEFVTTGFVGDRGAKGYVVSLANLNDLEVELDINQNDFAKLDSRQKATVTTDAYPDRKYEGIIDEISPEANRQKATVQVKVKILNPDEYLRPEMNSSVSFVSEAPVAARTIQNVKPVIYIPQSAVRSGSIFLLSEDKAVRRSVQTGPIGPKGIRVESGLNGGEELILNPPAELKDGDRVHRKQS